ncbi:MAG: ankyrin repeat domain-containing protein [Acidobacteriaceae bacterium]
MKKMGSRKSNPSQAFVEAILSGSVADVERFVLAGADINQAGDDGFSPLMLTINSGNVELFSLLIQHGADVNARNEIGQTPLMLAAQAGNKGMVQKLIVSGADLKATDKERRNAISWATTRGDFAEVISILGTSGADYDLQDIRGLTPLMRAALMGFVDSVAVLLTLGADESVRYHGKNARDLAVEKGNQDVCRTIKDVLASRPKGHRV